MFVSDDIFTCLLVTSRNVFNPLLHRFFFKSLHHFLFLDNVEKLKKNLREVLNTLENIMENGAFAPKEQMLHFP